ncbi:hypothetical protein PIB30_013789 [Stylosanthes scabra]|uniref:Uncharacterized protein n=1 Tax=Stylosanthes scabra TaxID=79078 RepID=A0ABU6R5H4_9FABA|nr:hypothetical protein [Stylosanthes scabra]
MKALWSPSSAAVPLSKPSISVSCTAPRSPSLVRLPSPPQPEAAHKQQQNLAARRSTTAAAEPQQSRRNTTNSKHSVCSHKKGDIHEVQLREESRKYGRRAPHESFTWDKKHDKVIKEIFNTRASKRLSGMMEDVRQGKEHLTQWCRPELKKRLRHYWENDEKYLKKTATNKKNRASDKCVIYTGGSATPMQTKANMTHTLKANKEQFADKRSSDKWDEFTENTAIATQQALESGTGAIVDPDLVWRQTVSEPSQKNRVFGIGGFLASTLRTSVFAPQASSVSLTSPAPAGQEEAVDLREQVQLLNQNIQDTARQLHESEEQVKGLHNELSRRSGVHDEDVEALKEQLREELRLIQEHQRRMGVTGEQVRAGSSSAAQDPPLHPPAPPEDDDDDADYVDL